MSLSKLFNPKSIAIIGASTTPGAVGHILVQNLIQEHYPGKIFPVNPKTDTLLGLACYSHIASIQETIDLAIIVVPAPIVPDILEEVAQAKIPAAVIISAGFKEAGLKGKVLEKQIQSIAKENNITLLGPNCLGFLHPKRALNASFAKVLPKPGNITFFSQSGALCTTILDETLDSLGYAHFVSVGNKAVIREAELLEYFLSNPETEVIAFYTEDLRDAEAIIALGKKALLLNPPKPVIALKSGGTEAGSHASSSHTGAVAGSDHAYSSLFEQSSILRAESFAHLKAMLSVFSQNVLPKGNHLAIVTNAGGMGVLATDEAVRNGLELASLEQATTQDLALCLPTAAGTHNPIDVLGDASAERYKHALQLVCQDPNVDMILVIVTPQAMTQARKTAEVIQSVKERSQKPVVAIFTEGKTLREGVLLLQEKKVAVLSDPEEAVRALGSFARIMPWQKKLLENMQAEMPPQKIPPEEPLEAASVEGYVSEHHTRHALEKAGFAFPKTATINSKHEAESAGNLFSSLVVLKILSPDILHKSDAGGVMLHVKPGDIPKSYTQILERVKKNEPKAKIEGVLVAEMIQATGQEILLGIKEEPELGKIIVLGMGGIYVEILGDVVSRFAPVNTHQAEEMILSLKSVTLLTGARGQKAMNIKGLAEAVTMLSNFSQSHPEIKELDLNPLVQREDGTFVCLDARIRV